MIESIKKFIRYSRNNEGENMKEYAKYMNTEEAKSYRIYTPFIFWLLTRIAIFVVKRGKVIKGEGREIPTEPYDVDNYLNYADKVLTTVQEWDTLKHVDKLITKDKFISISYNVRTKEFEGFEDSLEWSALLASGYIKLYKTTKNERYKQVANNLLNGCLRCFKEDVILRHPLKNIHYDQEPNSQDKIAALGSLIFTNKDVWDEFTQLVNMKESIANIFRKSDFFTQYPDGTPSGYDFHPGWVYNPIKAMCYGIIKLCMDDLNKKDFKIIKYMMQIPSDKSKHPAERSYYGALAACECAEALVYGDERFRSLSVDFVQDVIDSSNEPHAEFYSIAASIYAKVGYRTLRRKYSKDTLCLMSEIIDTFPNGYKEPHRITPVTNEERKPLPPSQRVNQDWYYQRNGYQSGMDVNHTQPLFEYISCLGRVIGTKYYPETTEEADPTVKDK